MISQRKKEIQEIEGYDASTDEESRSDSGEKSDPEKGGAGQEIVEMEVNFKFQDLRVGICSGEHELAFLLSTTDLQLNMTQTSAGMEVGLELRNFSFL